METISASGSCHSEKFPDLKVRGLLIEISTCLIVTGLMNLVIAENAKGKKCRTITLLYIFEVFVAQQIKPSK